ncbi:tetratricopeptide repeat protein [Actinocrispum wychmicini]|uniref:Tetratricopeptide repeat protein n=1 Tax=Actinocrispum wychmicini TaxID=1213861 RepID=A0A4R2JFT2_9PSEU|nr:tetratricopeptide repeat protein [Actinocrispum wychmicini]TCO55159.1 tetratricopeptide repeat protein [Actinocrispum wychmicini]
MNPQSEMDHVVRARSVGNVLQAQSVGTVNFSLPDPVKRAPSQLPPAARSFVNRHRELAALSKLAERARTDHGPAVAVITGLAGVGKTATCVWWGHQHRDEFDGGQLYADLADYRSRGAVDVADVLGAFLRALGVHDHYIPIGLSERAALFRTRTTAHRMLIMLDNVQQPAQVRPLLPGAGASVVLVASRRQLSGLLVDGASLVNLKPLGPSDGSLVVSGLLGREGVDAGTLAELVGLCGGLPIALRVAAARLMSRSRWSLPELVRYLTDEQCRLRRLAHGDHAVQTVFDVAYEDLPKRAKDVYHIVGILPGVDFDPDVIATAMNVDHDTANDLLGALCEANLMEELPDDRYRPHDLVRLHARLRAENAISGQEREVVARRIVEWYLRRAAAADIAVLGRERWRLAQQDTTAVSVSDEFDARGGMAWLETERANLLGAVRLAAEYGWHDRVWQFGEALWALYYSGKHHQDWVETAELGARAARAADNPVAEARAYVYLARARIELGEFDLATAALEAAQEAAAKSGDRRAVATVIESFGVLHRQQGRLADAIDDFQRSRQLNKAVGAQRGVAMQSYHVADTLVRSGQPQQALAELAEAASVFRQIGDDLAEARLHIVRGRALHALGRNDEAADSLRTAVATTRERSQPIKEVQALEALLEVLPPDADDHDSVTSRLRQLHSQTGRP